MAKGTGKTEKGPAPTGTKAAMKKLEETGTEVVVASVKAGALSVDVGPMVIAGMAKAYEEESKANKLLDAVRTKRYDLQAMTTMAVVKAAKADDSIDLAATFGDNKKAMSLLNDQLGLALGFRAITVVGEGDKARKKIGYSKAVEKFFPSAKEDNKSPGYQQKATTRSNFLHMLKKCAQAAHAIVVNDLTMTKDSKSGTLLLEGPSLNATFGTDKVLLNEKLTVGEGETATKLKERPSFTSIGRMGAAAEGKVLETRKQSGVASTAVDIDTAVQSLCATMISTLGKIKEKLLPKTIESLKAAQTAIGAKLV